ncbi:MAG: 16S rRNA (uracil(1498)-N(3))-methyltransferase [Acidimicrobiales bacterium]|nr:16S rRNA (uracil(1498)-N(3))-methyltransferase [Acidimicrobiales bacterium]
MAGLAGPAGVAAAAHAFVDDLDAPELDEGDRHHLERVLRLRPGDPVTVADGRGRWRLCRFGAALDVDGPIRVEPPTVPVAVGFAPVKGDRPDWVVQKLTELGVDRILVLVADRSVVRWDAERAPRQLGRLARISRAAAMQSRQARLAVVGPLVRVADAAARPGAALAEAGGEPPSLERPLVLVGPEGGWSPAERELPVPRVGLGRAVLRAETAAVAAGVLLTGLRSGLIRHPA